jgi:hypothetical protein
MGFGWAREGWCGRGKDGVGVRLEWDEHEDGDVIGGFGEMDDT